MDLFCISYGNLHFYYKSDNTTFILPNAKSAILLKSKTKLLDSNISINIGFIMYVKWPWIGSSIGDNKLILEYSFPFYQLKYGKYSSLSGNQENIHIKSIHFNYIPRTEPLTVVWMDNYVRHRTVSELLPEKCVIKGTPLLCEKIKVLTNIHSREYYLITENNLTQYKLKSWEGG